MLVNNLELKYKEMIFPIQISEIGKNNGFYIFIGTSSFRFNNLIISIPGHIDNINEYDDSLTVASKFLYEEENDFTLGKKFSERLCFKLKTPIYLSFNINDEVLYKNNDLFTYIEQGIISYLKKPCLYFWIKL